MEDIKEQNLKTQAKFGALKKEHNSFIKRIQSEYIDFFKNKNIVRAEMREHTAAIQERLDTVIFEVRRHQCILDP